jgi:glucose-6-phosphate 1-dehydrogenase
VNVPIIIRSGKSLSADVATVRIWFENRQLIEARVQPDPVLRLVSIARNGAGARYVDENLVIDPTEPGPYGRVLVELQRGERSWFLTERESRTVRAWLSAAGRCRPPLLPYDPGSIGPNSGPLDFSR